MKNEVKVERPKRVVVVGMSGKFSGSDNLNDYWNNLKSGKSGISFFTNEELLDSEVEKELIQNSKYIKAKGVIPTDPQLFDHNFFGISQREASYIDPQYRLLLQETYHALEDATIDYTKNTEPIGVFFSSEVSNYGNYCGFFDTNTNDMNSTPANNFHIWLGNIADTASTFTAYKLNLMGPAYSIQSACSSSLVSVHVGITNILSGECNLAVVGGSSISFPQKVGYMYEEGMINSPNGQTRSLDESGEGCVIGEGVGVVVLADEEYALENKLDIKAVILSSSVNNDGAKKQSYSASCGSQQIEVIKKSLLKSKISAKDIQYCELHGSGTQLGDSIELEAHSNVYSNIIVGSVKSNIGMLL
jgi:acyl transferase domain-containing protein